MLSSNGLFGNIFGDGILHIRSPNTSTSSEDLKSDSTSSDDKAKPSQTFLGFIYIPIEKFRPLSEDTLSMFLSRYSKFIRSVEQNLPECEETILTLALIINSTYGIKIKAKYFGNWNVENYELVRPEEDLIDKTVLKL